ncbi:MAG: hypothetical protein O2912_07305 [Proteobacteria bacterium]|nr:hypothetical protein [Pseudomonadota bacterium]
MDWHPIPDQQQGGSQSEPQSGRVTLDLEFQDGGVAGGWLDATGAPLLQAGVQSGLEIGAGGAVDFGAIAPLNAVSEWTAFGEPQMDSNFGQASWFEDTVPFLDVLDGETLADLPLGANFSEDVQLAGLVDQSGGAELSTDGLASTVHPVVIGGETGVENAADSPPTPSAPQEVVIFEFLV